MVNISDNSKTNYMGGLPCELTKCNMGRGFDLQVLKIQRLRAVELGHLTLLCLAGWRFQRIRAENTQLFFAKLQRNMCFGMEPIPLRKSIGCFLARFGKEIHPSSPLSI
jgi:hypothetical protein